MKEVFIGGDGSTDVVEQVACIHWWPGCPNIKGLPLVEVETQLAKLFQSYHCVCVCVCVCVCACVCVCVCVCVLVALVPFLEIYFLRKQLVDRWEALHKWQ